MTLQKVTEHHGAEDSLARVRQVWQTGRNWRNNGWHASNLTQLGNRNGGNETLDICAKRAPRAYP
jgi:hypothetical protein